MSQLDTRTSPPAAMQPWPAGPLSRDFGWFCGKRRLAVAVGLLLVYLLAYSPTWWVGSDSGLYLTLGRNLAEGHGYTTGGPPHTLVPPGFPLILAGLMKLGLGGIAALNAVMLISTIAAVWLCFCVLMMLVARDWAVLLTLFVALTREYVQRSGEILSDMPATVLVLAALWCYLRALRVKGSALLWAGAVVLSLLSVTIRPALVPLTFGLAVGAAVCAFRHQRMASVIAFGAMMAGLAGLGGLWFGYVKAHPDPNAPAYMIQATAGAEKISQLLSGFPFVSGQFSRLLMGQRIPLLLSMALFVLPVVIGMFRRAKRGEWLTSLVIISYVGGLLLVTSKPRTRYLVPVSPLLILLLIEGFAVLLGWIARRVGSLRAAEADSPPSARNTAIILGLMGIMLVANLALVGRLIWEKHQADYPTMQQGAKFVHIEPVVEFLRSQPPGAVLADPMIGYPVNRPYPILGRRLIEGDPSPEQICALLDKSGIIYIVFDNKDENHRRFNQTLRDVAEAGGSKVASVKGPKDCPVVDIYRIRSE